jgi:hypothetical protein
MGDFEQCRDSLGNIKGESFCYELGVRLGSRLWGYHPVAPRSLGYGPLCTAFSSAHHLQRPSTSSDMRDLC